MIALVTAGCATTKPSASWIIVRPASSQAGPTLLANSSTPHAALAAWINLFVDFLVTKHGLAEALQSDDAAFQTLHDYFLYRLVPVCAQLLDAAGTAGEIRSDIDAIELMRGVGNLCIGADTTRCTTHVAWSNSSSLDCSSTSPGGRLV